MNDGSLRKIMGPLDIVPGHVIRMVHGDGTIAAFDDTVIISRYYPNEGLDQEIKLARSYLYATLWMTSSPSFLVGTESFSCPAKQLISTYMLVLQGSGVPVMMRTSF
jgi:hypothetical protein